MRRLLLHVPAVMAGLFAGWLVSRHITPQDSPAATIPPMGHAAKPKPPNTFSAREGFAKLVEQRAPRPDPQAASGRLLFWDSREYTSSPVRAGLEAEVLRSILPVNRVSGTDFLDVRPEGSPGAGELLTRTARKHPRHALTQVNRMLGGNRKDEQEADALRRRVFREWLRTDPQAALAAAVGFDSSLKRGLHLQALIAEWSRLDPAAAAAALSSLPESGPGFTRKDFAATLIHGWHKTDPAAARQWVQEEADPAWRDSLNTLADELTATDPAAKAAVLLAAPQRDGHTLATTLGSWLTENPSAALAKIAAIPAADQFWARDAAQAAQWWGMTARSSLTPEQFLESINSVPAGPQREAMLKGLSDYGASNDIPFAVRMIAEMGEGRARAEAVGGLTELWMRKDPVKTSEWLATLPADAESRHSGVARFAETLAPDDPERAAQWAASIPDSYWQKESVMKTIFDKWRAKDPAAAETWLTGLKPIRSGS